MIIIESNSLQKFLSFVVYTNMVARASRENHLQLVSELSIVKVANQSARNISVLVKNANFIIKLKCAG